MLSLLLQEIAERHPEAALLRGVLEIGLRLRLLLVRPRLLARQTNAPSALLDRQDEDFHLAAGGEHAAMNRAARRAQLRVGPVPRLPETAAHGHPERPHAPHRAPQHGAAADRRAHAFAA